MPPIITLAPTGDGRTWVLAVDGRPAGEYPGVNTWRIRRDAFTTLADDHNMLIVWEARRDAEMGFVGVPFERPACDDGCPLGPRGHATVLLLGEPDDTCAKFRRAARALELANEHVERRRQNRRAGE